MGALKNCWNRPKAECLLAVILFSLPLATQVKGGQRSDGNIAFFDQIAGSWSGGGSVTVSEGSPEPIRCRATYNTTSPSQLGLTLRCASDSFDLHVESDLSLSGNHLAGTWTETSLGASGNVWGSVDGKQLRVTVSGTGISARMSLTLQGNAQSITLTSQGQISASALIVLRRS